MQAVDCHSPVVSMGDCYNERCNGVNRRVSSEASSGRNADETDGREGVGIDPHAAPFGTARQRLLLAVLVLVAALAPGAATAFAAGRTGHTHHWAGLDAARALAPMPAPAVVKTGRTRPWSPSATPGHGLHTTLAAPPAARSGAVVASDPGLVHQGAPGAVRRRGPPSPTS